MTERVALLGGTVHAGNLDGGGFRVRAHPPLRGRPQDLSGARRGG
jgi:hypothetical protein